MKDLDIRMEDRMNIDLYYPIFEYITQALMYSWTVDDLQLELWDGENAYIYISCDWRDIMVDIQDDQWEDLDWGWWCCMEDWEELNEEISKQEYITDAQRSEMNRMILAKAQRLYELCFIR